MGSYYGFIMSTKNEKSISNFIRTICFKKSEEELNQAESNFMRYIELVERISDRIADEKQSQP